MVIIGWNNLELVDIIENDEGRNKVAQTIPVDRRSDESVQNSNFDQVVSRRKGGKEREMGLEETKEMIQKQLLKDERKIKTRNSKK